VDRGKEKHMKVKIPLVTFCAWLFALSAYAEAQQPSKIPLIGFVVGTGPEGPNISLFRQGLRELGYIEGKNILIEYRYAEGMEDRLPGLVAELAQLNVDVLVVAPARAIRAAKDATKTIPIVMVTTVDPVATGLIDSLARPGGIYYWLISAFP
jgi:putative tryptophan/tyrosine transport system substrate-binding protein